MQGVHGQAVEISYYSCQLAATLLFAAPDELSWLIWQV
jgi:hypothetical protein